MSDNTYNGWTNYETWNVKLWMDNDSGSYEYWNERAAACMQDAIDSEESDPREEAATALAEELENYHDEFKPEGVEGVYADLLSAALGAVEWREIAHSLLSDVELWSAGWNMPGYLPDSEPSLFTSDSDARMYISDAMEQHASELDDEADSEKVEALTAAAVAVVKGCDEFGATIAGYHYYVTKV